MTLELDWRESRRVGTPWCAITTPDYMATINKVMGWEPKLQIPAAIWTCGGGLITPITLNDGTIISVKVKPWADGDSPPVQVIRGAIADMPKEGILFMVVVDNSFWESPFTIQAVSDCRDIFKATGRMIVFLGVSHKLPQFLSEDIPVFYDPLPAEAELKLMVRGIADAFKTKLDDVTVNRSASMCLGMTMFAAEEAFSRKVRKKENTVDLKGLSLARQSIIEQSTNKAITFEKEDWTFDQVGGMQAFKDYMYDLFGGPDCPEVVVRVDEIDKSISTASSGQVADNTGVSQDIFRTFLTGLEDNGWMGLLAIGGPGCLRGDTPIHDPITGSTKTVQDRFFEGLPFHVTSWDHARNCAVVALARPPRLYPESRMVELIFSNGEKITVTPHHRLWNGQSYVSVVEVCELLRVYGHVPLPSILGFGPSTQQQDALRWKQTTQDSPGDCLICSCSCDERLPCKVNTFRERLPLQGDAHKHNGPAFWHMDVLASKSEHSRPCRSFDHRSNKDYACHSEPLPVAECEHQHFGECLALEQHCCSSKSLDVQGRFQSCRYELPSRFGQSSRDLQSRSSDCSFTGTTNSDTIIQVSVVGAREVSSEVYYDFHVPVHNNYMACGVFHHNTGKTLGSICTGNEFGTRTLVLDLNAVKGSLVGESEAAIRRTMDVIKSIGGRKVLFIATANRLDTLPPELQRRFWLGTYFWDSPNAEERKRIWEIQRTRFKIDPKDPIPNDEEWVGSDIRNCCRLAYVCSSTLQKASERITLAAVSSRTQVEKLRTLAEESGFRSVSKPGPYQRPVKKTNTTSTRSVRN